MHVAQALPVVEVSDLVSGLAEVRIDPNVPVLQMRLEEDEAETDEHFQPVAGSNVVLDRVRSGVDHLADPFLDLPTHQ